MSNLVKIRELSLKYDVSARTLRYYEDMGLIKSIRSDDYAYRLYDETAIKRLEQILILRRLNISIKDIKRIFSTTGSEVVLDVLGKKVDNIDEEVSLLHELKKIVLEFIAQRKKELISYPSEFPVHDVYKTICTYEELKSGFKVLHEIFMHYYEDILNDPADMLLPMYDMNEYDYFSKEARFSREESYKCAKLFMYWGIRVN